MLHVTRVLVVLPFLISVTGVAQSQSWSTIFGAPPAGQGLNNQCRALQLYQTKLIAGGAFTQAGPIAANHVAAWDGTQWEALGSGTNAFVHALAEYNGELIAAGEFTEAGGVPVSKLARWNGSAWSALTPPGTPTTVWSAYVHAGLLYVNAWDNSVSKLAWWDGNTWATYPLPVSYAVILGMTSYQDKLYMTGGSFSGFLYSWDGSTMGGPGYVFDNDAYVVYVHDDLLHVGGIWYDGPPGTQPGVSRWNGSSWVPSSAEFPPAQAFKTFNGRLVVGLYGVTSFDGDVEVPMDDGNMYIIDDLEVFQGNLYVSGFFDDAGGNPSFHIASWSEPLTSIGNESATLNGLEVEAFPNPFNPTTTLRIHLSSRGDMTTVVYDATGRAVKHLAQGVRDAGIHVVTWDGTNDAGERVASGVYIARVGSERDAVTRNMVLLK